MPITTLQHLITQYGYIGIFSLLMVGIFGVPVPDEILLTLAGFLSNKGDLHLMPTLAAAFLGSVCGITLSYGVGRFFGILVIKKYGRRFHLTEEKIRKVETWFLHVGKWALTIGYFLPGIRHLIALVAGSSKLKWPIFASFAYAGALIWTTTFLSLGYYVGGKWRNVLQKFHHNFFIAIGIVLLIFIIYLLVQKTTLRQKD